ncbi:glycosyltransferase N-terminal domain-containing protein [Acidiferrobacter thiooxydans]|jgi:hypothetical protein|uniref:glycosyltransferase N-terminal domain-containing protein n=1 Tax=Acidiferrobacter thiooxydans TaxID=163359 RepID=UPI001B87677D|nr:glycosyltransferase N-terminal domain-containing protein [Acidiferrobacter thiooxydans]MDA8191093.1 hypothetical protein [Gammaproteobacteria bacterium]
MADRVYEGQLLAGVVADVRDRLSGNTARANARLGLLRPPPARARLIWIKSDAREVNGRLAAEIAGTVRERSADRPIVVTFEYEHQAMLARLRAIANLGFAYGPADRRAATRRILERLRPAYVVALGEAMRPHLAAGLKAAGVPCCIVHGRPGAAAEGCMGFPQTASEQQAWRGRAHCAAPFYARLAVAQVEPVFQGLAGAHARALFWVTDASPAIAARLAQAWQASPGGTQDILFLGCPTAGAKRLSAWNEDRRPLAPGSVVWVDEERFWPALAASCTAIHLMMPPEPLLWAALAGGRVVSAAHVAGLDLPGAAPLAEVASTELVTYWAWLLANPGAARVAADALRRYFWQERRAAGEAAEALVAQVCAC